jgi:hypothetical protein
MDKTKRVSSPPDPAAPLGRGRSRIQSLRDGVASALRSTRRASDEELEVPSISRASLLAELNRIRRATQQHGRLLETLERASHELRRQGSVERGVGAQQRELVLTDQDRGLAALLDEYEAKLDQVRAERDAATQLVRQQKTMVDDQDEFLAGLLDEHEAKLSEAYAQRDEAQELVEEQKAMLNDHDRFLAELLDEHEEDMAKAVAERDQLQQRIRQLQRELSATRPVAPQGAAGERGTSRAAQGAGAGAQTGRPARLEIHDGPGNAAPRPGPARRGPAGGGAAQSRAMGAQGALRDTGSAVVVAGGPGRSAAPLQNAPLSAACAAGA